MAAGWIGNPSHVWFVVGAGGLEDMKQGTVWLADRHSPMLEGVCNLLEGCFQAVVRVADEASLFEAVQRLQPECAIVDVSFPLSDGSGGNIISHLHRRAPELKLITLSVHNERAVAERVLELGLLVLSSRARRSAICRRRSRP